MLAFGSASSWCSASSDFVAKCGTVSLLPSNFRCVGFCRDRSTGGRGASCTTTDFAMRKQESSCRALVQGSKPNRSYEALSLRQWGTTQGACKEGLAFESWCPKSRVNDVLHYSRHKRFVNEFFFFFWTFWKLL